MHTKQITATGKSRWEKTRVAGIRRDIRTGGYYINKKI